MTQMNTYLLMLELNNRITDFLYDPEPQSDIVLEDLKYIRSKPLERLSLLLEETIQEYTKQIEARVEVN